MDQSIIDDKLDGIHQRLLKDRVAKLGTMSASELKSEIDKIGSELQAHGAGTQMTWVTSLYHHELRQKYNNMSEGEEQAKVKRIESAPPPPNPSEVVAGHMDGMQKKLDDLVSKINRLKQRPEELLTDMTPERLKVLQNLKNDEAEAHRLSQTLKRYNEGQERHEKKERELEEYREWQTKRDAEQAEERKPQAQKDREAREAAELKPRLPENQ